MFDLIAVGELLIDFTPETLPGAAKTFYSQNSGGAPANVLSAAATLGAKTALISRVGNDAFGRFLIETVQSRGINIQHISQDPEVHTTLAFVHLDASGDRSFSFYRNPGADMMLSPEQIPEDLLQNGHIFHFGSVSMSSEPARSATLYALERAKAHGCLISYDPNYRASLWPSEEAAIRTMKHPLSLVDLLKVSAEELPLLTGTTDLESGSKILAEQGISLVLVSLGSEGAFYRLGSLCGTLPPYDVKTIDTTGAGDAFLGAVLWQLKNMTISQIKALSRKEIEKIVAFANAAGGLATTRKGAISVMPSLDEINACLHRNF